MINAVDVIPNVVRNLTMGGWITQGNLGDFFSMCEVLRSAQDDRIAK
jgi:hypothetical protein